ncbi:hypothetical protein RZS08_43625, partial [Arthrospira platensis SPKY1]|nr:hypothetical protein [Arthrospira platensis SPKY1]
MAQHVHIGCRRAPGDEGLAADRLVVVIDAAADQAVAAVAEDLAAGQAVGTDAPHRHAVAVVVVDLG